MRAQGAFSTVTKRGHYIMNIGIRETLEFVLYQRVTQLVRVYVFELFP